MSSRMKPSRTTLCLTLLLLFLLALIPALAQSEPLRIVTTSTQAGDLAGILTRGIPDGAVEITRLMGPGVDPHLYKPTEADIVAMNRAAMVVYSGLHLEGQFDRVFEALSERGVVILSLGEVVKDGGFVVSAINEVDVDDPHFWFEPRNWALAAGALGAQLADSLPEHADLIAANAADYVAQLNALYAWADDAMRRVPETQRYLVTSHDAFQYFGMAFGWQMIPIQGISTAAEAGVGDIQSVVDFIVANDIPVLFVESSVPPTTIEAVQEAVRAAGGDVALGVRELYSDAMGDIDTFGGTYIGMIAENVLTILQSYKRSGVEFDIPEFPNNVQPQPPQDLLEPDQVTP
jgi:manganese/zinc/iron transport system substrate-binding protein